MVPTPLPLAHVPTPLERADRLGAALGMAEGALWVKRDDCTGLAGGGNKARKLAYLCADALAKGSDTLVTGGGRQSNHVRMTAAAAAKLGDHDLVLGVDVGTRPDLDEQVPTKAAEVATSAGRPAPTGHLRIDHERFGTGYGATTDECRAALDLAGRREGLVLDPVYTG